MKIEESFAVKRNENYPRWKVYIEWLRGLENTKEEDFPLYLERNSKHVGISSVGKMCIAWTRSSFDKIYTLDEAFERFKDKGLVMPLSSSTKDGCKANCRPLPIKANSLTREDYEKVWSEWKKYQHKNHIWSNWDDFINGIFNPNKDRIDEIDKEIERLEAERKTLEI